MATKKNRIEVVIDGTTKGLHSALNKAGQSLKTFGKVAGVAAVAGVTALTAATMKAVRSTTDYALQVDRMAKTTGMAAEEIQKLGYAALQEHTSMDTLEKSVAILSKNMLEASEGAAEYKDAFDAMGIAVTDANGQLKNTGDVLMEMADYMQQETDDTKKAALAKQLLGRSGAEMVPFLEQGSAAIKEMGEEAERLGIVLTQDNIVAFKQYQDSVDRMKQSFAGIKMQVATSVLPAFQGITDAVTEMFVGFQESGVLEEIFTNLGGIIESLIPTLEAVFEALGEIFEAFGPVVTEVLARLGEIFAELMRMIVDSGLLDVIAEMVSLLADSLLDAIEGLMPLIEEAFGLFAGLLNTILPLVTELIDGIITAGLEIITFGGYNANIKAVEEAVDELTDSWDDLTEAEQRATLAEMKRGLEAVRNLCGENSVEFAELQAAISEFELSIGTSKKTIDEWHETFRDSMLDSVEIGSGAWDEMMSDARQFGKDFAENNKNMHTEVAFQTRSANREQAELAREGMRGFIEGKMDVWEGVGKPEMEGMKEALFQIIANPEEWRGKGAKNVQDYIAQMAAQYGIDSAKIREIEDDILLMLGLHNQAYNVGYNVGHFWGSGIVAGAQGMASSVADATRRIVGSMQHTGGLLRHSGGVIEAHRGLLASDEVMVKALKGEFIMQRSAVEKYGVGFMEAVNAGNFNNTFHFGDISLPGVSNAQQFISELNNIAQQAMMRRYISGGKIS